MGLVKVIFLLGCFPACAGQVSYSPLYHLATQNANSKFAVTGVTLADGGTVIFTPYPNNPNIFDAIKTKDFFDYTMDTLDVEHLVRTDVKPLFVVYDRNTSGFGDSYLVGINRLKSYDIVKVIGHEVNDTNHLCRNCINQRLSGTVSTSWDISRNRWVTLSETKVGRRAFAVSVDLKTWATEPWFLDGTQVTLEDILEVFPIAEDDDPNDVTWVIVKRPQPDRNGRTKLTYATFKPDDEDQMYREMGSVDDSTDWEDFAVVADNATDYRRRRVVVVKSGDYTKYGVEFNKYISGRVISYSKGKLSQYPAGLDTWPKKFVLEAERYTTDTLKHLPPSVSFRMEASFGNVSGSFGFQVFVNPNNSREFGVSLSLNRTDITLDRWFLPQGEGSSGEYTTIASPYTKVDDAVKVLIMVDVCIVEYFVYDGRYAGSIVAFPSDTWNLYRVLRDESVDVGDFKIGVFDDLNKHG